MARILDLPFVVGELTPFVAPSGNTISSRAELRRDLEKSKAIPWEPGIEKDIARRKTYETEAAFKPIAEGVDNIVREMNVAGRL